MREFNIPKRVQSIDDRRHHTLIAIATDTIASLSNRPLDSSSAASSPIRAEGG